MGSRVPQWATLANYPAGANPWNAQPLKVAPAQFYFTPQIALPAETINWILNQYGAAILDLEVQSLTPTFMGSYNPASLATFIGASAACFDPVALKWIIAGPNSTPVQVFMTGRGADAGDWTVISGGPSAFSGAEVVQSLCRGIEPAVSNKYIYAGVVGTGIPQVVRIDTTITGTGAFGIGFPEGTPSDATFVRVASLAGAVVAAIGSTSTGHTGIFYSTDHGATWTNTGMGIGGPCNNWLLAQGLGLLVVIPAHAGVHGYFTTPDGVTWTSVASGLPLIATETPSTLVFGADDVGAPCFVLATTETVANRTNLYRSYDGLTWSAITTDLPAATFILTMAAVGSTLIATLFESAPQRVIYSNDGGDTWFTANCNHPYFSANSINTVASENQFLIASDAVTRASTCIGDPGGLGSP